MEFLTANIIIYSNIYTWFMHVNVGYTTIIFVYVNSRMVESDATLISSVGTFDKNATKSQQ